MNSSQSPRKVTTMAYEEDPSSGQASSKKRLSPEEWKEAVRFNRVDAGWVILSIGMAIGAGIIFLPVQAGRVGIWCFLASAVAAYPSLYLFQRLFINTLAESKICSDYPAVISGYLGKNWGIALGALYFFMLIIWIFVYFTDITNDSASYLQTFGVTKNLLSRNPFYSLALIGSLVSIAARGEQFLFRISVPMVLIKLGIIVFLGVAMIKFWNLYNVGPVDPYHVLVKQGVITLPFTLTSILFIQTLSPMMISYRARERLPEIARYKALRVMNIAFLILFGTVFFYALSFTLAFGYEEAEFAFRNNISALAMAARFLPSGLATTLGITLNIFAIVTAFFSIYLGFHEVCRGLVLNIFQRFFPTGEISSAWLNRGVQIFTILLAWGVVSLNIPILYFTSVSSPIFGLVGCLIPAWLVLRVPELARYRNAALVIIILTGMLLIISPFLAFWSR